MAAVEILESEPREFVPHLRVVTSVPPVREIRVGVPLSQRRHARLQARQRRHRALAAVVIICALAVLAIPGHVFGATTGAGLSTDYADSSVLASGMEYVVQPGDSVSSLARDMNPTDPSLARSLLIHELGSSVVVPGEHVLIP